jgi:ABC-type branched-subunit amino acid transport system substrate-binding protein
VAEALARAGDVGQAEAVAASLTDPFEQAQALTGVAEALERTEKDGERLQQLVASALAQTRDYIALLPLIARINPAVVIEFAQNMSYIERPLDSD